MRSRRLGPAVLALVPALALAACGSGGGGGGGGPEPIPVVRNHAIAAESVIGSGALRVVVVSEHGTADDFTGDGDRADLVLQTLDLERGTLVNTALALTTGLPRGGSGPSEHIRSSDSMAVFRVSEAESGRDLDADGTLDFEDLWVFDRGAGALDRLPVRDAGFALDGGLAAFRSFETGQERVQVFDVRDRSLVTLPYAHATALAVLDPLVVLVQAEAHQADLNGDGDVSDEAVLRVYDTASRTTLETGWAVTPGVRVAGGHVGAFVSEVSQGGTDLDGDGLVQQEVFVVFDAQSGAASVLDLRVARFADWPEGDAGRFALLARERDGEDLNSDGDSGDLVLVLHDPRTGATRNTGLATRQSAVPGGRWLAVHVAEGMQGETDLDGDGNGFGDVVHVLDTLTGGVDDLRVQGEVLGAAGEHFLLQCLEVVAGSDANGDGDLADLVLLDWDARARRMRAAGRTVSSMHGSAGELALVALHERAEGEDLDGDGDDEDFVLALYSSRSGTTSVLGLATDGEAWLGEHGGAMLVPEWSQGADLNGDGDLDDRVLHTLRLGP